MMHLEGQKTGIIMEVYSANQRPQFEYEIDEISAKNGMVKYEKWEDL